MTGIMIPRLETRTYGCPDDYVISNKFSKVGSDGMPLSTASIEKGRRLF